MKLPTDLALYDRFGQIAAYVEVKKISGTTAEWADQYRRRLFDAGEFPRTSFFFLVAGDYIYVWKDPSSKPEPPTYLTPTEPILKPYCERVGATWETASGYVFEMMVESWFWDLIHSRETPSWMEDSGFSDVTRDGRVANEFAA